MYWPWHVITSYSIHYTKLYEGSQGQSGQVVKGSGAGERQAQEAGGGLVAGEGDSEGRCRGKLLSPERRRQAVRHAIGRYGVSQRLACRIAGQPRGTQRYHPIKRADEDALTQQILSLACQYGRYGYRRITVITSYSIHYTKLYESRSSSGRLIGQ